MEKFSIGEESETEVQRLNPLCIKPLPKYCMINGTVIEYFDQTAFKGILSKTRKGISSLFFSNLVQVDRFFYFEDEFLYALSKTGDDFVVQESWNLRRLFKLNISKENHQKFTLILINKSHNPLDDLKEKNIQIFNYKDFLEALRKQLSTCDIDLN